MSAILVKTELKRFKRGNLRVAILVPLLIVILLQIAIPETREAAERDKWIFYAIVFCFWLGLVCSIRGIVSERRALDRLRLAGASASSLFISKATIVALSALIHGLVFGLGSDVNLINWQQCDRVINECKYGETNLVQWAVYVSADDEKLADKSALGRKLNLHADERPILSPRHNENTLGGFRGILLGYVFALSSLIGGILGLAISALCGGNTVRAVGLTPLITAFQIIFSKVTVFAPDSKALFGSLSALPDEFKWYHLAHVMSFFTCSRYLVTLADAATKNTMPLTTFFFGPDTLILYFFGLLLPGAVCVLSLKKVDFS